MWRSSNYRPLKLVLHVRPGWIIYQNMRETWEKKSWSLNVPKKMTGGGGQNAPPPPPARNGIRVKRQIKVWQWFTTRGSYVHKPMVKFGEASRKCYFFVCNFLKILTVSDKTFTRLLEFIKLYKQNPLEKFFIFTIYQNYTLALEVCIKPRILVHVADNTEGGRESTLFSIDLL